MHRIWPTKLRAAREHTRRLADDLAGERELGPKLAIVNPPRWEVGHVGWFQEFWCLRGGSEEGASILPNADALYNSATVPHDTRWTLPLPSFADTLAYRDEVLERDSWAGSERADAYFVELALRHELMHAEAFHYTRQTLGYPAPDEPAASVSGEGDIEYPGGVFRLGANPGEGFAFDNEKWSHPVVLEPFRMARRPVTYGEYRKFARAALLQGRQGAALRPLDPDPGRRAGAARELARREGVLRLGRPAAADRGGVGVRRAARPGERRPRLGMDREHLPSLSRLPARPVQGVLRAVVRHPQGAARRRASPRRRAWRIARFRNFYTPERADMFVGFRTCAL